MDDTDTKRPSLMDFSTIDFEKLPSDPFSPSCFYIKDIACSEDYHALRDWMRNRGMPFKVEYDAPRHYATLTPLARPGKIHETACGNIGYVATVFNVMNSGSFLSPLSNPRSTNVRCLDNSIMVPDDSHVIDSRECVNFVIESEVNNLTLSEFIAKLRRYITNTDSIMYALGWKRLEVASGVTLLAIAFSRLQQNVDLPLFVINFGNAPISYQAMGSLRGEFGQGIDGLCRGLGFNQDPECTQAEMPLYTVVVPLECIACLDTAGQQLYQLANNAAYIRNFEIDLFAVRLAFITP